MSRSQEIEFDLEAWKEKANEVRRMSDEITLEGATIDQVVPKDPVEPPENFPMSDNARAFLEKEALAQGVEVADLRKRIETHEGWGRYLLERLRTRQIRFTEFWNALEINFVAAFALAYSNGAMEFSDDQRGLFAGRTDGLVARLREDPDIVVKEISYHSSMDPEESSPQFAEIAYDPNVKGAPVVILQHGSYPGSRMVAVPGIYELAARGVFGIAVSKRGRDGSAGQCDAWGLEVADIVDALDYCEREYAAYLDPTNVTIRGQSGGGADCIAAMVRYPDRFRCVVPFMGYAEISELYGFSFSEETEAMADAQPEMKLREKLASFHRIGYDAGYGLPDQAERDSSRNFVQAAENNLYAQVHFVWDEQDTFSNKMDEWFEEFRKAAERTGANNVRIHKSKQGDVFRYPHWISPDSVNFERFYLPQALAGTYPAPVLASAGHLVIPGYLKTRPFEIMLGDGRVGAARVEYEVGLARGKFSFSPISKNPNITGTLRFANPKRRTLGAEINGQPIVPPTDAEWIEVAFRLTDTVTITR